MLDADLIETEIDSAEVYKGQLLHAYSDRVRLPDGQESTREYVRHPGAVLVLALLDNGRLLLERQFRYPLRRVFLELPAGKIDPGEPHLDAARRELREETGYKARNWRHIATLHPCIGYSDEHIEIFLARELIYVGHQRDHNEFLEIIEISLADAIASVHDGDISDGKTIAGLFWAEKIFSGAWPIPA